MHVFEHSYDFFFSSEARNLSSRGSHGSIHTSCLVGIPHNYLSLLAGSFRDSVHRYFLFIDGVNAYAPATQFLVILAKKQLGGTICIIESGNKYHIARY